MQDHVVEKTQMDRLVCGDWFRKAEVAICRPFLAVQRWQNKSLFSSPTTLPGSAYIMNFCDRFADWPVEIELLIRFVLAKQSNVSKLTDYKSAKLTLRDRHPHSW